MKYLKVEWIHDFPDEPIFIYSELDDANWELRKVEVFRDGSTLAAGGGVRSEGHLSDEPLPGNDEISQDSQFILKEIDHGDFEIAWRKAVAEKNC
ncbi:DUF6881 domain-containing protein [Pseudomonas wadenswilerensis]